MQILPIFSVREEDKALIGVDLGNLAKLHRLGFPVAEGIVVLAPDFRLKTVLEHFNFRDKEVFEQQLIILKDQIKAIPVPDDLESVLKRKSLDPKSIWLKLLEIWLDEIRSRVWRQGFVKGLALNLTAQSILFTDKIVASGDAYYNPEVADSVINTKERLTPEQLNQLDNLVVKANKSLLIPQIYYWVIDKSSLKVKIIKIKPFTNPDKENNNVLPVPEFKASVNDVKSSTKIFVNLGRNFTFDKLADGVIVEGDLTGDFDLSVAQLIEAALSYPKGEVIFRLPEREDQFGGVKGSLYLLHNRELLKKEIDVLLFARNKKKLTNISLAIPCVRSVDELLRLKREMSSWGVNRKGNLKFWLEIGIPENIINLEEYLEVGLDGVILNLDSLLAWIGGFDPKQPDSYYYSKNIKGLLKVLDQAIRLLHKYKLPFIASGQIVLEDDLLYFLVDKGVWAVVVGIGSSPFVGEHLKTLENRVLKRRVS